MRRLAGRWLEAGIISEKITRGKKHTLEDRVTSCIVRDEMGVWGRFFTSDIGNYNSNDNQHCGVNYGMEFPSLTVHADESIIYL